MTSIPKTKQHYSCHLSSVLFHTLKRNNMVDLVAILLGGHLFLYFCSLVIRVSIYKYIKKKLPGLQSILDLLILDLIRVQTFNYTFFILVLLSGYFHGRIPFILSQMMIFIIQNSSVYLFCLYQYLLLIKATLVFKGLWLEHVSDWTSNCLDVQSFCIGLDQHQICWRHFSPKESSWTNNKVFDGNRSGVVSRLLKGQHFQVVSYRFECFRLFYTGPFYVILPVTVLVSNILLQTKLQRLEEKSRTAEEQSVEEVRYMFRKIFSSVLHR